MIPMTIFDPNCLYVIKCLALVFVAAPCVLFAGGMLICLLMWCGLHITRAMHLRRLGLKPGRRLSQNRAQLTYYIEHVAAQPQRAAAKRSEGGRVGGLYRGYFKVHSPQKKEKR